MRDSWRKQVRAFFRACLKSAQALDFTRDNQIFVVAQRDAMLGCETLVRNRAYIDCGNMKLYLKPTR